jgi:hypothetical protein
MGGPIRHSQQARILSNIKKLPLTRKYASRYDNFVKMFKPLTLQYSIVS